MAQPTCCKKPSWTSELDLDHAGGFEYVLGKCARCGAYSMNVFCVATGITGFEAVSSSDVERMRAVPAGPERKALLRQWCWDNLDPGATPRESSTGAGGKPGPQDPIG